MSELDKVEGKTFLITGGASGLGAGCVAALLNDGAKSVAILDISEHAGTALAEKLNKVYPEKVIFIKCDVSNDASLAQAFNDVVNKFETLDVVINNAGIMNDSAEAWKTAISVNYQALVSLTLKSIKYMSKSEGGKGGTIINVASITGYTMNPYLPIYAGTKAAVLHFTNCIVTGVSEEETGVRILSICYGATATALISNLDKIVYDDKYGKKLIEIADDTYIQRGESAVKGLVHMFKHGNHGSVWLAYNDLPVKDITPAINEAYGLLKKTLAPK